MTWTCPQCLRTFATRGQSHSHDVVDIDRHFAGRPAERRRTFDRLAAALPETARVEALQ